MIGGIVSRPATKAYLLNWDQVFSKTKQVSPNGGMCPVCGCACSEEKAKLVCKRCNRIIATCCEGG